MPIEKIIVVEDDLIVRKNLEQILRNRRYDVAAVGTISAAEELLLKDSFDVIFLDVRLPDGEGTTLLKSIQTRAQRPLVVMVTGFASVESAVSCMRDGAFDYLIKPFSSETIEFTLKKADEFNRLVRVNQFLSQEEDFSGQEMLGLSKPMEQLRALIRKVARTQATVLIQGESGTGKELVARAIYRESPRAHGPFIKLNCAAVPENLIESEFFGHEKGSFTGALNKREGRFELAHGGTIFLDEVSEVSPQVQAKLLRVLQEREFERVGGNKTIKVDVRVIATTNRRLEESVEKKEFRQDLFFRLNVVPIHMPPLRDRSEDIPYLAEQFMQRLSRKHGVRVSGISAEAMNVLRRHSWPGNVRELQNVVERAVILCTDGEDIQVDHLGFAPAEAAPTPSLAMATPIVAAEPVVTPAPQEAAPPAPPVEEGIIPLDTLERMHILQALERCGGNRTHTAKKLGISVRTLRNKLSEYGVSHGADGLDEESSTLAG
ncbi:MAG TPA: sigma-54 dependent transcriptional regulator [Methylomirabilota bacterium]|nr:sigma-54 dependent transcriptional regulator [Methylomirabilota bacterium]